MLEALFELLVMVGVVAFILAVLGWAAEGWE